MKERGGKCLLGGQTREEKYVSQDEGLTRRTERTATRWRDDDGGRR